MADDIAAANRARERCAPRWMWRRWKHGWLLMCTALPGR
jgi:hypothetical protein